MKNVTLKGLSAAVAAAVSLGVASNASADVYGLGFIDVNNLTTGFQNVEAGGVGLWTFRTSATADLNNSSSPGATETCNGVGLVNINCGGAGIGFPLVLSGPAQNAPGATGGVNRGENDTTFFGTGEQYSNSESVIVDAQLVGDAVTRAVGISESNLTTGSSASASTNTESLTGLDLTFTVEEEDFLGGFSISFDASWAAVAGVMDLNGNIGAAQGNVGASLALTSANGTTVRWAPDGIEGVEQCTGPGGDIECISVEGGNLNVTATAGGTEDFFDIETGEGAFSLTVTGLASGEYNLAYVANTSTLAVQIPAPGTLLLMGAGLLAAAGFTRRKKA